MVKWEYKVLKKLPSEKELNALGNEGWELVAIAIGARWTLTRVFLKRRKISQSS